MKIMVSVLTTAYNHASYIRAALDGFVMQKTTFPFEVIIHDDASTDGTADIIREYAEKYPDIIRPILQKENQYSQGHNPYFFMRPLIRGKYIAQCEGDDYWTDPLKLQKQVDALEAHPETDICAHRTQQLSNGHLTGFIAPYDRDLVIPVREVILGDGGYVGTASLMYRKSLFDNPPPFFKILALDYCLQILGSLRGGMLYLNDSMAVRRVMSDGSWTKYMDRHSEKRLAHMELVAKMLVCLNQDTCGQYDAEIKKLLKRIDFHKLELQGKYREMILSPEYRENYHALSPKERLWLMIFAVCPGLKQVKMKIKSRLRK